MELIEPRHALEARYFTILDWLIAGTSHLKVRIPLRIQVENQSIMPPVSLLVALGY